MVENKIELLKGTLDLLVLKALALPSIAWARRFKPDCTAHSGYLSGQTRLSISGLTRHGRSGLAHLRLWESENNRRAKGYRLTKAGQRQLKAETEDWRRISLAIANALQST
jgi:PadR family transcriptional regulator, regulatory protein PadR